MFKCHSWSVTPSIDVRTRAAIQCSISMSARCTLMSRWSRSESSLLSVPEKWTFGINAFTIYESLLIIKVPAEQTHKPDLQTTLPDIHFCHHYLLIKCVQKWKNSSCYSCVCSKHVLIGCRGRRRSEPIRKQSNELDAIGILRGGSIMSRFLLPENVYTPPSGQKVNFTDSGTYGSL